MAGKQEWIEKHLQVNDGFARRQGLDAQDKIWLEECYAELLDVLKEPEKYENPVAKVEELEYRLQELWRFDPDPRFHRYGLFLKGCTCPRLDNQELIGHTTERISASDCPWHKEENKHD